MKTKIVEKFMLQKYLSIVFIGLIVYAVNPQIIQAQSGKENSVEKIKNDIRRREAKGTKIVVKLKDGTKLEGYITQVIEDSFDITNYKTQQTTTVPYRDVAQVKKQGLSKGAKVAIGVGAVAAIVILALTLPGKKPLGTICPLGCGPF
jgi:hypothetical protein